MRFFSSSETKRTNTYGFTLSNLANLAVRFIQIIFACVVIGFYASDLNAARKVRKYADSKWVFAVVVGTMAAITALVLAIVAFLSQYRTVALLFAWEWILFFLWVVVTGIFGNMYFRENAEMDSGVKDMKNAAIFDVVNMLLWFATAVVATIVYFKSPRKSLFTGRANL